MPSLLIIDDEPQARANLQGLLKDYCPEITEIIDADGVQNGRRAILQHRPDIVLLDIHMNDGTGFELLETIPSELGFRLIFTTADDEHALKAFQFNALDYLLKPIDPSLLQAAIQKAAKKPAGELEAQIASLFRMIEEKKMDRIALPAQEGITYLQLEDILYLKSEGNYTLFYCQDGSHPIVTKAIKEYEATLPEKDFFRVHQSYIVHAAFVRKFVRDESIAIMSNGDHIPVAKRRRQEFLDWLSAI